jgi:hypothetical protein
VSPREIWGFCCCWGKANPLGWGRIDLVTLTSEFLSELSLVGKVKLEPRPRPDREGESPGKVTAPGL